MDYIRGQNVLVSDWWLSIVRITYSWCYRNATVLLEVRDLFSIELDQSTMMCAAPIWSWAADIKSMCRSCSCASCCMREHALVMCTLIYLWSHYPLNTSIASWYTSLFSLSTWSCLKIVLFYIQVSSPLPRGCCVLSFVNWCLAHLRSSELMTE